MVLETEAAAALVLTRNAELARNAAEARPDQRTAWRQTFSSALTAIARDTDVLVVDAELGAPMAYLLASLFVGQRSGRRAVVVDERGAGSLRPVDERVRVLEGELDADLIAAAIGSCAPATRAS